MIKQLGIKVGILIFYFSC